MKLRHDERGISRLVSYMLTVGIAMILITGLLLAGSQLVADQRDRTTRSQLDVIGNQIAGSLEAADRIVRSTEAQPNELNITRSLPERAVDSLYSIEIRDEEIIVSETGAGAVSVVVPYRTETDVETGSVSGGKIVIEYDQVKDELVISNA